MALNIILNERKLMINYILRRIMQTIAVLICVSVLIFLMVHMIPGDPARQIAGMDATEEQVTSIRQNLGLDRPLLIQYLRYMRGIVKGDLGRSLRTRALISQELKRRFPYTIILAVFSVFFAGVLGVIFGVFSSVWKYSFFDHFFMMFSLVGVSIPNFWIGIMMILLFSVKLPLLPSGGVPKSFLSVAGVRYIILPVITLGWTIVGMVTRLTRSSMLEVIQQDFIRTAHAKGLPRIKVIFKHALKNAILPVVTYLGLQFGFCLGGAVITETVFSWPGVGRYLLQGVYDRDYPVIQSTILVFSCLFVMTNLVIDISYTFIDPRIRYN